MARKIILTTTILFVICFTSSTFAADGYRTTTKTRGNHSYVCFKPSVSGGGTAEEIVLTAMQEFEENHPELRVTSWQIQHSPNSPTVCYLGIWVHHSPKSSTSLHEGTPPKGKGFRP